MILVDTSVWIDYLRDAPRPAVDTLDDLLQVGEDVRITEPVIMELLVGGRHPREQSRLEALTNGLPLVPLEPAADFRAAAGLYRASAANGHPIRSMIDCLIAAVAIRSGAQLLHSDRDFTYLAEVAPLDLLV